MVLMGTDEAFFEKFTKERYNETMGLLSRRRKLHGLLFTVASAASVVFFYLWKSLLPYGTTDVLSSSIK